MADFGNRLKTLRNSKKLTQKKVAESIGSGIRNYQCYEYNKQQPTLPVLVALADYFDVSLDYLVGRSDNPKRS